MGVFHFYSWFRKQYSKDIYRVNKSICENNHSIDNLLIDMNGLFHTSTQKIYKYGLYKQPQNIIIRETKRTQLNVFSDICDTIENILITVNPNKRLILCVDGQAPLSKMYQQRKRRYKNAKDRTEDDKSFDNNNLTPGTQFMDYLSKYLDWFIKSRISTNPLWQNLEIIYSPSSVPGEGEYKLLSYIRKYGRNNESYVIHGLDADLIMLSLLTHFPKFYILRDDTYDRNNNFLLIDIGSVRTKLIDDMKWDNTEEHKFIPEWVINDFVFLCFMVGNDFLPNIPSLEIIEGGIEVILQVYNSVAKVHGHITRNTKGNIIICKTSLLKFFEIIAESEKELLQQKIKHKHSYFPDELLDSCSKYNGEIDIDKYRDMYNSKHFEEEENLEKICHNYLVGMQWIITYYTKQVPSWRWFYPYHYAPFASTMIKYINTYQNPRYHRGIPLTPFQQLLTVLPTKSSSLLPKPLDDILEKKLIKFCPEDVIIDLSGKRQEYMGIILLPNIDVNTVIKLYNENIDKVDKKDIRRDSFGKSMIYIYDSSGSKTFFSYYGNIPECKVNITNIDI
jgi:5'-3' exonuclease